MMAMYHPASIVVRAQALAEALVTANEAEFRSADQPADSFMVHRPNGLAENYKHGQGVARQQVHQLG